MARGEWRREVEVAAVIEKFAAVRAVFRPLLSSALSSFFKGLLEKADGSCCRH